MFNLYNIFMGIKEDIKILLVKENLSVPELAKRAGEFLSLIHIL